MANVLKAMGVRKGDVVTIYLPRIPEIFFAMLACAKIGAVHSVVFAGYSSEALNARVLPDRRERHCGAQYEDRGFDGLDL